MKHLFSRLKLFGKNKQDFWEGISTIADDLFTKIVEPSESSGNKITVVGMGQVGTACSFSLLTQFLVHELSMVDADEARLKGELLDFQHGASFMKSPKVEASTDYKITANSKICIVTAGVRENEGESKVELVQRNLETLKIIIPQLIKYSPNTILLIVSNPVEILTYVAWKLSGLPTNRVFGSGTNLDTARLRYLISEKFNISVKSVHGWIIGEHGESSIPVWSGVNVAGVMLKDLDPNFGSKSDRFSLVHREVVDSANEVIRLKRYTSWSAGLSVATLCHSVLHNSHSIHAVSTAVKGIYGIDQDVFLSLPCVLGENGVSHVVKQQLSDGELQQLHKSAKTISDILSGLKF